jgi:hypothetical protein
MEKILIVLPTSRDLQLYGKPETGREFDPLSVLLARTDTEIGKTIVEVAEKIFKKKK